MKVIYTFIAVAITSSIFLSCKDTQSNSPLKTEKSEVAKPINKAAVKPEIASFNMQTMTRKQVPLLRRKIGIVFQDFKLLSDRNVFENLAFVMRSTGWKNKIENLLVSFLI